jgi:Holin of 3TMs, for gene-transfer release
MNPLLIAPIFDLIKSGISKVWPDPAAQAEAERKLAEMAQAGLFKQVDVDLQLALAQAATNTAEAQSTSLFRGGWRPYIGWVCGTGLAYQLLVRPIGQMILEVCGVRGVTLIALEMETLTTLLFGMLGLGAMRTFEKFKGMP